MINFFFILEVCGNNDKATLIEPSIPNKFIK